ncbi:MAG: twin-arginine translocation signal domain-containing protein [Acidobacteria bacterium]|nr:twin-arginine translocation signal domain-containing protein [Acidobacteriota bacterium]
MSIFNSEMTRRELLQKAAMAGLLLAVPWADRAVAAVPPLPEIPFKKNKTGDGIIGPYGEARIFGFDTKELPTQALPLLVSAADDSAVMDITGRSPFVRFGSSTDSTAITLTSSGVTFGKTLLRWSPNTINQLVAEVSKDPVKARGALLLRSALHTSYPIAVTQLAKGAMGEAMATAMAKGSAGYGASSMKCTTETW